MSRVLDGQNQVTQAYNVLKHKGIDLVKYKSQTCNVIAHTNGKVVWIQTGQKNNKNATGNASYGNCVKIKHPNGYYTLYAHLKTVDVKLNQQVSTGQVIGYMGNTGRSSGAHLHFEVRNTLDVRINPTPYIDADLPKNDFEIYSVYDNVKNKWLPSVKTNKSEYAGNFGNPISGLKISNVTYKVHDKAKKKWLPPVTGDVDYAGNLPNDIDAVAIKTDKLKYRVHLKLQNRWLGWVDGYSTTDITNGYAGNIGESIDAIQIQNK